MRDDNGGEGVIGYNQGDRLTNRTSKNAGRGEVIGADVGRRIGLNRRGESQGKVEQRKQGALGCDVDVGGKTRKKC